MTAENLVADSERSKLPIQVLGACPHDCPDTCALVTTVVEGQAIKVAGNPAHRPTAGVLCKKVSLYPKRTYHADRLRQPMRRVGPKGAGQFEPISWDEAIQWAAQRLMATAAIDPQRILPYSYAGTMGLVQGDSMSARFFHAIGASRLNRTICASAGATGLAMSVGASIGTSMQAFVDAKLILLWGTNSITSNLHLWRLVQQARRQGCYVVAIDPIRTETAEHCDLHIAIRPGTDAALAMAIGQHIVEQGWADLDYLESYTHGAEAYIERIKAWTPERASLVCDVPAQVIRDLARRYATTRPAAIRLNYGMQRARGGGNAVRAVACLPALVGAWRDVAGGLLLSSSGSYPVDLAALQRPDLLQGRQPRIINMSTIGDALLQADPPIQAMIVYNSNPVAVAPDTDKVRKGFAREDLFTVVLEHFQTDTADYADLLLPATTQLEHVDIHRSYGHRDIVFNHAAIAPVGEALPNTEIFRRLAAACGLTDPCFAQTDLDIAAQAFVVDHPAMDGYDFEQVRQQGWFSLSDQGRQGVLQDGSAVWQPFAAGGFPTPSGKFEFFSDRLAQAGMDPLPDYLPPYESVHSNPTLASQYPLAMITPPARNFLNSSFVNIPELHAKGDEPSLVMHPDDAAARGLVDGQQVNVRNDRGVVSLRLTVNDKVKPGVVMAPSIWWLKMSRDGQNINRLISQRLTDLGEAPTFYDVLVQVSAAQIPASVERLG